MNKKGITDEISNETGISQEKVTEVINSLIGNIKNQLVNGGEVRLIGLGTFSTRVRTGHVVVHPVTREKYNSADKTIPRFIASSILKKAVA